MREYGIMKSMGVTPAETGYLIMIEIFLINISASILGVIIGLAAVYIASISGIDLTSFTSHNRYFAVSGVIYPRLTFYSLALPLCMHDIQPFIRYGLHDCRTQKGGTDTEE
jgi:ABC-type antimicrobial peptide transport system permease subunit